MYLRAQIYFQTIQDSFAQLMISKRKKSFQSEENKVSSLSSAYKWYLLDKIPVFQVNLWTRLRCGSVTSLSIYIWYTCFITCLTFWPFAGLLGVLGITRITVSCTPGQWLLGAQDNIGLFAPPLVSESVTVIWQQQGLP